MQQAKPVEFLVCELAPFLLCNIMNISKNNGGNHCELDN